jgi:drug/metabolite transporter (DMT)-like permease
MPPVPAVAAILGLALVSTAYAYILFFRVIAEAGATNTSLVTLLVPPSAILLGYLFLVETLQAIDFAGMALIAAGLAALDGRILKPRYSV